MKKFLKKIYGNRKKYSAIRFYFMFLYKHKYLPDFKNPLTFSEKISHRKKYWKNELFSRCSDKIEAKKYVSKIIGNEFIIENYFVGKKISAGCLRRIIVKHGPVVIKANHNSGPVYLVDENTCEKDISIICSDINNQIEEDYGQISGETWYSEIIPKVLVEKRLTPEKDLKSLLDYKFHVFNSDGNKKVVIQIDYDRNTIHTRSFFDENLNWIPMGLKYPITRTVQKRPKNFGDMVKIAKTLSLPFSYVRVDLYNNDGNIYFGEMTFAHGSGSEEFSTFAYDNWMGQLWKSDPRF